MNKPAPQMIERPATTASEETTGTVALFVTAAVDSVDAAASSVLEVRETVLLAVVDCGGSDAVVLEIAVAAGLVDGMDELCAAPVSEATITADRTVTVLRMMVVRTDIPFVLDGATDDATVDGMVVDDATEDVTAIVVDDATENISAIVEDDATDDVAEMVVEGATDNVPTIVVDDAIEVVPATVFDDATDDVPALVVANIVVTIPVVALDVTGDGRDVVAAAAVVLEATTVTNDVIVVVVASRRPLSCKTPAESGVTV